MCTTITPDKIEGREELLLHKYYYLFYNNYYYYDYYNSDDITAQNLLGDIFVAGDLPTIIVGLTTH